MNYSKTIYINEDWGAFSKRVKRRDGYQCLQCKRGTTEVTLQVHHEIYVAGKAPWEYALSDCLTLCKGCHAKEHGLIEPDRGWTLLSIDDLGALDGTCERKGCGAGIRYAHLTYHPKWGYMVVGSTCIEHLTQEDRLLSSNVIHLYKNISHFVHASEWDQGFTKKGKRFIASTYKHHEIRIYGEEIAHSFQLALKEKGIRWHNFGEIIQANGKSTLVVKELAYTALRGTLSDSEEEKYLLRNLYRELKANT
ncbi:MAG: hypothetical protein RPT95_10385 [Candidatus Sedimenticola sp. (ex Thyasira tokunagai)]